MRWLARSLRIEHVILFVRSGERYEVACGSSVRRRRQYAPAAGGALERLLSGRTGLVPVEWQRGIAHIQGSPLEREESAVLSALGADFLLGLPGECRLDAFLCIGGKGRRQPLGMAEVCLVRAIAAQSALVLENWRLRAALAAGCAELHQRDWEMDVARDVQNRLFPAGRPRIAGLDYYSDWRPARGLSGDYLDYFKTEDGSLGLGIGDVAGKGLAAALLTSSLHSTARALRLSHARGLSGLVASIDELFYEICPDNTYATLFVARYDPGRRLLEYVNAGHEPPVVLRKTAAGYRPATLEPTGPVVGMLRGSSYREGALSLGPGDVFVLYTDGLCEATNATGEQWGFRRLLEAIRECGCRRARDTVDYVFEAVDAFAGDCPRYDDMTLWLGRVEEAGAKCTLTAAELEAPVTPVLAA
jgi:sigma-B regulation protein RsbU (phosphoserine phosphatase)